MRPTLDTTKYAIIYPRQSTGEQVENNVYSLERQLQLREYAVRDGFPAENIMVIDDDLGISGRSIEKRPGFTRALKMIGQGIVAALYVEDLNRLSRDERTIDQMVIADACERGAAMIYMGRSWYDMRDAGQRQSYKYQAVGFSEYWKAHVAKLQADKREKAMDGKAVAKPPRGYRVNRTGTKRDAQRDRLIIHEDEAEVIRNLIAQLPAAGSVPKLFRATYPTYWPDGKVVTFKAIRHICSSPIYRGTYAWGEIEVPDAHPAILTAEDVATIERLNELNRSTKRRPGDDPALLAGLLWCPSCGRKINRNQNNRQASYRCAAPSTGRKPTPPGEAAPSLHHFDCKASVIDDLIMADFWRRIDRGLLDSVIAHLEREAGKVVAIADADDARRRAVQRRIDGYLLALGEVELGEAARKMLVQQLNQASEELGKLEGLTPKAAHINADLDAFRQLRADAGWQWTLRASWDDEPMQWRRGWLRRFIERIDLIPDEKTMRIVVRYLDGSPSKLTTVRRIRTAGRGKAWDKREWEAYLRLLPKAPPRGKYEWIAAQMAAKGFEPRTIMAYEVAKRNAVSVTGNAP